MRATKPKLNLAEKYSLDEYLALLANNSIHLESVSDRLRQACRYSWDAQNVDATMPSSLDVALLLSQLGADETTLVVCLLSDIRLRNDEFIDNIKTEFGEHVQGMVKSLLWLNNFQIINTEKISDPEQTERLRRMLLSMIDDVRVMLIKLAYRVQRLRELAKADEETKHAIAQETMDLFAPLANRLGMGQLKWELEDLSFRYLEPTTYKRVAKLLEEKREEREAFIDEVVTELKQHLKAAGIDAQVYGRPKHIYSIWKKMTRKQKDFNELFDVRAVRITVNNVAECYTALGIVHGRWYHIAKEFDDYIANAKENGYQSLHTAVYGPHGKPVEIQIRTHEMHEFAEYGVAAHWRYKEGSAQDNVLEKTINSLRKLLDPNETDDEEFLDSFHTSLFSDRVFVLTPQGKVIDMPYGATPLDFAYAVHTEVGHKCRGAKVNGHIVPLTYTLQNGEQVDVLTTSQPAPSRDWLNPNLGYLKTSRARAKVRTWYKQQDYDQHVSDGRLLVDRELHRLNLHNIELDKIVKHFKLQTVEEWYATIGRGDITTGQLNGALNELFVQEKEKPLPFVQKPKKNKNKKTLDKITVRGVDDLLTTMANCCMPVPGDDVIGFITRGKGVTIHRKDCSNILNLEDNKKERLIEVEWSEAAEDTYPVNLFVRAIDRTGLLRDISKVLADEHVNVVGVNTKSDKDNQTADMSVAMEISDLQQLQSVMDKVGQLPNIMEVRRAN